MSQYSDKLGAGRLGFDSRQV